MKILITIKSRGSEVHECGPQTHTKAKISRFGTWCPTWGWKNCITVIPLILESTSWTVRANAVTQEQACKHMCTLHLLNVVDPVHWIIYLLPAWWKFYKRQKERIKHSSRKLKAKGDGSIVSPFLPVSHSQGCQWANIFTGCRSQHDADISTRQMRDNAVRPRWAETGVRGVCKGWWTEESRWEKWKGVGGEDGLEVETAAEKYMAVWREHKKTVHVQSDINRWCTSCLLSEWSSIDYRLISTLRKYCDVLPSICEQLDGDNNQKV